MIRYFLLLLWLAVSTHTVSAQDKAEKAIRDVLAKQAVAWNKGDIEGFMDGYWKSDSLLFVGKNGPAYGYNTTLARYKQSYPTPEQMGQLKFTILQVKKLSKKHRFVLGRWELKRVAGDLGGYFTLIFRKIDGAWVVISDHSS